MRIIIKVSSDFVNCEVIHGRFNDGQLLQLNVTTGEMKLGHRKCGAYAGAVHGDLCLSVRRAGPWPSYRRLPEPFMVHEHHHRRAVFSWQRRQLWRRGCLLFRKARRRPEKQIQHRDGRRKEKEHEEWKRQIALGSDDPGA